MPDALERYDALRATADPEYAAWRNPERPRIDVALDQSSITNGALKTRDALERIARERNAVVDFGRVHGYGMQWVHPTVQITFPDGATVLYGPVREADAAAIIDEATGRWGAAAALRLGTITGERPGVPSIRQHPFFALEPERRLLKNIGLTDPESLNHYIAQGGYRASARIFGRHLSEEIVRNTLNDAGLTGRGGANFPAGTKWGFLFGAPGTEHYLVCNADEGDPGAWVNRVVMEGDPHLLLEGMLIGAYGTKSTAGFIYLRDEYPLSIARMEAAIRDAEAAGLLGDDILGTGMSFHLRVIRGAGAYVCGDETGLLASISDERGMPRVKPPFPAARGALNKPSNVNNVETFANVPLIATHGSEWYREMGTKAQSGTKIFSFSGDIVRTGFMEVPFGVSLAKVLEACGGIEGGRALHAIQPGGPLGSLVPASALDKLILEPASFLPYDAMLGSGGIVFGSDRNNVLVLAEMFAEFVEEESCGRCTTCHGGNQRKTEIIRRVMEGDGRRDDEPNLMLIDKTIQFSNCAHGQLSPKSMRNVLQHFHAEYEAAMRGEDATLSLKGATRFRVVQPRDPRVEEAVAICPVAAFRGTPGARTIDEATCIHCQACTDVAPGAVVREAKPRVPRLVPIG